MAQQKSKKGKGLYLQYKSDNRVYKNKIKKLERHCKEFPDDKEAEKNLARIKKDGYKCRERPLVPGSNPTVPKRRVETPRIETIPEQLSRLLNIPMPKVQRRRKKGKTPVTIKKRKNVKQP